MEYKADVKKKLTEKKEADAKNAKEDAVITAIIEDAKMDLPEPMVATQQRQMVEDFAQRIQQQGLSIEQYFQFTGLTPEKFMEQTKPQAERRIKSRLVLEAVVAAEKIEVSDDEFNAELEKMAEQYKMEIDKIKEMVGEYETKQIKEDIAIQKAVEFVVSSAKEK